MDTATVWVPREGGWSRHLSFGAWVLLLAAGLIAAGGLVYVAGGTRTAWPHVFYLPIVLAALPFGRKGSLTTAAVATLLCGPFMPLDSVLGIEQDVANWLTRGTFYLAVGLVAGASIDSLRSSVSRSVADQIDHEVQGATTSADTLGVDTARRVRDVLTDRSFHPVFQPIYALSDGRLLAVEALTRFDAEPHRPPNVWFDEATRAGMGPDLDLAATEVALEAARELPEELSLHINVSTPTLHDPRLLRLLASHPDRKVVLEITEHAIVDDYERLGRARDRLRDHGVRLAVDDTGTGFASLRHVIRLAPEVLKLDMGLVRRVRDDLIGEPMAGALIEFAENTGSLLVVQGIEEHADLVAWQRLGAHAAQGYLLGRPTPLPAADVCHVITALPGRRRA